MISIITRCYNRLEYTVQVLDAVKRRTKASYEHIIVDNSSSDGTAEWFHWMAKNTSWYDKIRYFRIDRNLGDWGGMLFGFSQAKGDYIVQLDNDIIPAEGWLSAMIEVLNGSDYRIVMLKRANVAWKLKPLSPVLKISEWETVRVERAVACYMMHRLDFEQCVKYIPESKGLRSKYIMAGLTKQWKGLKPIGKITNLSCIELQAEDQRIKYDPKNSQIWEKI